MDCPDLEELPARAVGGMDEIGMLEQSRVRTMRRLDLPLAVVIVICFHTAPSAAASLSVASPSEGTLMDEMIAAAAAASREKLAQRKADMDSFGSGISGGFLGSLAAAPAAPAAATKPSSVCASCGQARASFKKCGRCKMVKYCSEACQRAHWPSHKPLCGVVSFIHGFIYLFFV
jgi:hypothetical protein